VLYVMLVAHFPEFDRNVGRVGRVVLRLPSHLWKDISSEAKALVQGLLCYETDVRLTASDAMRHDWIGSSKEAVLHSNNYQFHPPSKIARQVYDLVTTNRENQRHVFDVPPIHIPPHLQSAPPPQMYQPNLPNPDLTFQSHQASPSANMIFPYGEMVISDNNTDLYLRIAPLVTLQR
jgi:serine/threonine protein kinase